MPFSGTLHADDQLSAESRRHLSQPFPRVVPALAADVLSDPEARRLFDRYGAEGMAAHGAAMGGWGNSRAAWDEFKARSGPCLLSNPLIQPFHQPVSVGSTSVHDKRAQIIVDG